MVRFLETQESMLQRLLQGIETAGLKSSEMLVRSDEASCSRCLKQTHHTHVANAPNDTATIVCLENENDLNDLKMI